MSIAADARLQIPFTGYKTSLVRCFRLLKHTQADLTGFCDWKGIDAPGDHNWNREWWRCQAAARILKAGGTEEKALSAASDQERELTGYRAEGVISAARCLADMAPFSEQHDVKRWAEEMGQWMTAQKNTGYEIRRPGTH